MYWKWFSFRTGKSWSKRFRYAVYINWWSSCRCYGQSTFLFMIFVSMFRVECGFTKVLLTRDILRINIKQPRKSWSKRFRYPIYMNCLSSCQCYDQSTFLSCFSFLCFELNVVSQIFVYTRYFKDKYKKQHLTYDHKGFVHIEKLPTDILTINHLSWHLILSSKIMISHAISRIMIFIYI